MTDEREEAVSADSELEEYHLKLRNLRLSDYPDVQRIMDTVYASLGGAWTQQQFAAQIRRFPEGQICIEDNGRVVAFAITLIVNYDRYGDQHSYKQITGNGWLSTHDPNGDVLYGVDVCVDPEYRQMRLGRRLYVARKELCRRLNLRAIVAGGRIPGYRDYADRMSPEEYIELVRRSEIYDPILSFQLANEFHVRRVIRNYIPDAASHDYATLVQWDNIFYEEKRPLIGGRQRVVRLGTVQWQMRPMSSIEELMQQVEFFVDALAGYNADFALFPEFFSGPLLSQFNQDNPAEAIRGLAQYTQELVEGMAHLAVSYNINIIAGSMPVYNEAEHQLFNVSYICHRDGSIEHQNKIHITPDERSYWGVVGGNELRVFDTDVAKIGVLICFDAEYPELPRLLAEQGMQLLFVPYWTDTQTGYLRVRRCAQARAIENECYVAITGSVGNLPNVENMDIQYSQSAVFSPADFAFPHDAVMAESTPNTEMTLIVDVDLDKLTEIRHSGSVRNFQDRRLDLYRIEWLGDSGS